MSSPRSRRSAARPNVDDRRGSRIEHQRDARAKLTNCWQRSICFRRLCPGDVISMAMSGGMYAPCCVPSGLARSGPRRTTETSGSARPQLRRSVIRNSASANASFRGSAKSLICLPTTRLRGRRGPMLGDIFSVTTPCRILQNGVVSSYSLRNFVQGHWLRGNRHRQCSRSTRCQYRTALRQRPDRHGAARGTKSLS